MVFVAAGSLLGLFALSRAERQAWGAPFVIITSPVAVPAPREGGRLSRWYRDRWVLHKEGRSFVLKLLSFVDEIGPGEAVAAVLCSPWHGIPHRGHRSTLNTFAKRSLFDVLCVFRPGALDAKEHRVLAGFHFVKRGQPLASLAFARIQSCFVFPRGTGVATWVRTPGRGGGDCNADFAKVEVSSETGAKLLSSLGRGVFEGRSFGSVLDEWVDSGARAFLDINSHGALEGHWSASGFCRLSLPLEVCSLVAAEAWTSLAADVSKEDSL